MENATLQWMLWKVIEQERERQCARLRIQRGLAWPSLWRRAAFRSGLLLLVIGRWLLRHGRAQTQQRPAIW